MQNQKDKRAAHYCAISSAPFFRAAGSKTALMNNEQLDPQKLPLHPYEVDLHLNDYIVEMALGNW